MVIGKSKLEIRKWKLDIRNSKMETRKSGLLHFCPLPFDLLWAEALSCAVTFSLSPVACPLVLARHWSLVPAVVTWLIRHVFYPNLGKRVKRILVQMLVHRPA
jgi:hypothetical protein